MTTSKRQSIVEPRVTSRKMQLHGYGGSPRSRPPVVICPGCHQPGSIENATIASCSQCGSRFKYAQGRSHGIQT